MIRSITLTRALTFVLCLCASHGPSKDETTEGRRRRVCDMLAMADISSSLLRGSQKVVGTSRRLS